MRALRARDSNVPLPPRQRSKPENYVPFNSFSQETAAGPKSKPVNRINKNGARITNIPKKRFEMQLSENVDGSGSESDSNEEFPLTQADEEMLSQIDLDDLAPVPPDPTENLPAPARTSGPELDAATMPPPPPRWSHSNLPSRLESEANSTGARNFTGFIKEAVGVLRPADSGITKTLLRTYVLSTKHPLDWACDLNPVERAAIMTKWVKVITAPGTNHAKLSATSRRARTSRSSSTRARALLKHHSPVRSNSPRRHRARRYCHRP